MECCELGISEAIEPSKPLWTGVCTACRNGPDGVRMRVGEDQCRNPAVGEAIDDWPVDLPEYYYDEDENLVKTDPENLPILQRPLRAQTAQGEITALASSVMVPAGSRIKFCIQYSDERFKDVIVEWLNYGAEHGLGAWRNSGRGAFRWREINEDWSPIIDDEEEE